MFKKMIALSFVIYSTSIAASAGDITELNVFKNRFRLGSEIIGGEVTRISLVDAPSLVEAGECDGDGCLPAKVLATTPVVQVRFEYVDLDDRSESSGVSTLEVNFPRAAFSAEELAEIKAKSEYFFDLTGKKARELEVLSNRLISFSLNPGSETVSVIDYEKSDCTMGDTLDDDTCEKVVRKDVEVNFVTVEFNRK